MQWATSEFAKRLYNVLTSASGTDEKTTLLNAFAAGKANQSNTGYVGPNSTAISEAIKVAKKGKKSETIVVTLSGRGDKDVEEVQKYLNKNVKD